MTPATLESHIADALTGPPDTVVYKLAARIRELEADARADRRAVEEKESHPIGTADSVYFRRELTSLIDRIPSADGPWMGRYLRKLADVAELESGRVVVPEHVAWLRYRYSADSGRTWLQLCNSNDEGAFKVYREPIPALAADEVAVKRADVELAIKELDLLWPCDRVKLMRGRFFDALRANQGGAAT